MQIYTLEKSDIGPIIEHIPEAVANNISEEGYYTLGAASLTGEGADLMGMIQFHVDSVPDGDCYAELTYVYVSEESRRQSVGTRMVMKADSLLVEEVDVFMARTDRGSNEKPAGSLSRREQEAFLRECGFISNGDEGKLLFRFTGR